MNTGVLGIMVSMNEGLRCFLLKFPNIRPTQTCVLLMISCPGLTGFSANVRVSTKILNFQWTTVKYSYALNSIWILEFLTFWYPWMRAYVFSVICFHFSYLSVCMRAFKGHSSAIQYHTALHICCRYNLHIPQGELLIRWNYWILVYGNFYKWLLYIN